MPEAMTLLPDCGYSEWGRLLRAMEVSCVCLQTLRAGEVAMVRHEIADMDGFALGTPALVCRWRISRRHLPLANRHLRALLARHVQGQPVSQALVAWAKQHIEWTLEQGAVDHPDGTLMLLIDEDGRAAMTVGPYEPLEDTSRSALMRRAAQAQEETRTTGVAPETLWVARGDQLLWDPGEKKAPSGAASLVMQLAQTLGLGVATHEGLLDALATEALVYDEAFLVSDEHGVVPASNATGRHGRGMAQAYQRLLEKS